MVMSTKKSILKSAGVIGLATLLSRILGFVRDIIIAKFFGTGTAAEAFVVAFRIPNLLRDLVAEGASNSAFVPVFSEYAAKRTKEEFWELANVVLNVMMVVLGAITIIGIAGAPLVVRLIAPGFAADSLKFNLTVGLTRLIFPYMLLIGLAAYSMGVLNSLGHFATPAFGPCLLNISVIVSALIFGEDVLGLALGVLTGGVLQLALQAPALYGKGLRPSLGVKFYHPAAKRIAALLGPRAIGACVYQINVFVDTMLASLARIVGEGGVAALYYSNRLVQFPLAIFGISVAQAALPSMSVHAARDDVEKFKETLSFSLRTVFFVMVPASVGLAVLARPITAILFQRGSFNVYSTQITSFALLFYSLGIFAYSGVKVLVSGFYALQDTKTPLKIAAASLVVNIALNLILMFPLKVGGLALATSISALNNFLMLFFALRRKVGAMDGARIASSFLRVSGASALMGAACFISANILSHGLAFGSSSVKVLSLAVIITVGIASYAIGCFIFRVEELKNFLKWALKRR